MWPERLLQSPVTHGIQLAARFAEERQRVLAENVANLDTPDYRQRRLDDDGFRAALRGAFAAAEQDDARQLELRHDAQVATDAAGRLHVNPATEPPPNVLFHDGGNRSLEQLMTDVQQNALEYRMAINLLKGRFNGLMSAIRGRTQ